MILKEKFPKYPTKISTKHWKSIYYRNNNGIQMALLRFSRRLIVSLFRYLRNSASLEKIAKNKLRKPPTRSAYCNWGNFFRYSILFDKKSQTIIFLCGVKGNWRFFFHYVDFIVLKMTIFTFILDYSNPRGFHDFHVPAEHHLWEANSRKHSRMQSR